MIAEGPYTGTIEKGWLEKTDSGDLLMCFSIKIKGENEIVTARHVTFGQYAGIGEKVAELLELDWPKGLRDIEKAAGKTVPVKIKHKEYSGETYVNAYIVVNRPAQPATPEQIEMAIAKMEAQQADDSDALPF